MGMACVTAFAAMTCSKRGLEMAYNQLPYLAIFLPAVLIAYKLTPAAYRKYTLLASSWIYFYLCSQYLLLYLVGTTVFVYLLGLAMEKFPLKSAPRKALCGIGIAGLFGTLLYVKYTNFFIKIINTIGSAGTGWHNIPGLHILVPIGISFYTLEAVSYLLEVDWGRAGSDHDFCRVALFLGFFPQTMEGPIARYQDTAMQLTQGEDLHLNNIRDGAIRIVWGLFKKMLIADRLNTAVGTLFTNYTQYHGSMIAISGVFYALQLYMEFSGVMDIVIGSAQMFGIKLPENFRQPFFSQTAAEFWRRWHITLGVWCKTYIFYPVTTSDAAKKWNKFARKKYGKYIAKVTISAMALAPVWMFNGLWHGPQWNYIFYGIYYLVLLELEEVLEPVKKGFYKKTGLSKDSWFWHLFRILRTWLIIFTGEMFFRANGLRAGLAMFRSIFYQFHISSMWDGSLLKLGLDAWDFAVIILGTATVFVYDLLKEKDIHVWELVSQKKTPVRWALVYCLVFAVVIFGAYGAGYQKVDLIYAGF